MPAVPRNVIVRHDDYLWSCSLPNTVTRHSKVIVIANKGEYGWQVKGVHIGYFGATEVLLDILTGNPSDDTLRRALLSHARRIKADYTRYGYWRKAESMVNEAERGIIEARRMRRPRVSPQEAQDYHDSLV
jgi:hypothetical protein